MRRLRLVLCLVVPVVLAGAAACSSTEATGDTSLAVTLSGSDIVLENLTGQSLVKGEISVMPQGIGRPYTYVLPRMGTGQKSSFVLSRFRMSDGTPFRVGFTKGKSVKVTASDATGKSYMREIPFE
jgi:hypothetical protein